MAIGYGAGAGSGTFGHIAIGAGAASNSTGIAIGSNAAGATASTSIFGSVAFGDNANADDACVAIGPGTVASIGNTTDPVYIAAFGFTNSVTPYSAEVGVDNTYKLRIQSPDTGGLGGAATGGLRYQIDRGAGASTNLFSVAYGCLDHSEATSANSGATPTTVATTNLPASTLTNNGDAIEFMAAGTFAASANNKQLQVLLGGTTIFDSTSLAITSAASWALTGLVVRSGSNAQRCTVSLTTSSSVAAATSTYTATTLTDTGSLTLALQATGGATNDLVCDVWRVLRRPGVLRHRGKGQSGACRHPAYLEPHVAASLSHIDSFITHSRGDWL